MRLDKFLVMMAVGSRSQVKDLVKKGLITVNGIVCKTSDYKINEEFDTIQYKGHTLTYQPYQYYMLHKPKGVVTATQDDQDKTVMDLLDPDVRKKDLFPVGRLDKDTEGLLLITNNGPLAHRLLSPKHHVDKTYLVHLSHAIDKEGIQQLEEGIDIGDEKPTLPAKVEKINDTIIHLTIREGRFHQIKRMVKGIGNEVIYLKRLSFGSLTLDKTLETGKYRPLTRTEIEELEKSFPSER